MRASAESRAPQLSVVRVVCLGWATQVPRRAVADHLEATIETVEPRQAKALLRLLIKDLRVNARSEILPTYRVVTPAVCALPSSVGRAGIEPATLGLRVPCSTS